MDVKTNGLNETYNDIFISKTSAYITGDFESLKLTKKSHLSDALSEWQVEFDTLTND